MSREQAIVANERIHGSVDRKHGKRDECVDWHEKNFDCNPWHNSPDVDEYRDAMNSLTKAVAKSVGKWINNDPEMKQLLQRVGGGAKHGLFDTPEQALSVHGWTFVRYVCESLSWWTGNAMDAGDFGLPWTDFNICSHQSDLPWGVYDKSMELLTKEVSL